VAGANRELVQQMLRLAGDVRKELGEYMRRGSGQRATGNIISGAPVISHPKDWGQVPETMQEKIARVRAERHPGAKGPKGRNKRGKK
jgi:arylsulfatase